MEASNESFKKTPEVVVTEQDVTTSRDMSLTEANEQTWAPGAKKRMPYFGFAALFVVILASVGQLLVLLFANGRSASDWVPYVTPNVFLSVLNGIASLAITFAVMQGIAIAWWRRALMGASIKELHYTWNFSTSVSSIFMKYRYFNSLALAALMTKVAIIDGVLFQRSMGTYIAISFRDGPQSKSSTVSAWSQTDFPITGILGAHNVTQGQTEYEFSVTVMDWIALGNGVNYRDPVEDCDSAACLYGLPGAGFSIDCNISTEILDSGAAARSSSSGNPNATMFSVDFHLLYPDSVKNYARLEMDAKWPAPVYDENWNTPEMAPNVCSTNFTISKCELRPAVLNYTVAFTNATSIERSKLDQVSYRTRKDRINIGQSGSRLGYSCQGGASAFGVWDEESLGDEYDPTCSTYDPIQKQVKGVEVLRIQDVNESSTAGSNSHLLGIYNALKDSFTTSALLEYSNGSWSASQSGALAPITMARPPPDESFCNYTYGDPTVTVFNRLNVLMLQTSVSSSLYPNINTTDSEGNFNFNQVVTAHKFYKDIYYTANYRYAGAALGMTLLVIICILPSYYGFWQLGRDVTLGPFEIAYAFQGPAFSSVQGDGRADQVVRTVGRTRVQYGEVEDAGGKRLAFKMTDMPPSQAR